VLRILILSIPDLGSNKKFVVLFFFVATNFPKFKIISLILANSQRIFGVFIQKYGLGTGIRDLGSEIQKNLFQIPDPGVKKTPDPGSGSATLEFIKAADMDLDGTKGTNGDVKGLQIHF
jgi:hypothetical protein